MNGMFSTTANEEANRDAANDIYAEIAAAKAEHRCYLCGAETDGTVAYCDECEADSEEWNRG